jgi:hypothetical protein
MKETERQVLIEHRGLSKKQKLQYGYYQFLDHFLGRDRVFRMHNKSRRKLFSGIHQSLKQKGEGKILPVPRRKDLSIEEFRSYYVKHAIPVVLEGKAKDWKCSQEWSLSYFSDLHGKDEIVHVDHTKIEAEFERLTLKDVIDNIRGGGSKYYRFYPLLQKHPEHIRDFDYNWLLACRHKWTFGENFQVFMGGKGSYTPLHNASSCNLFTQAYGEKEWILYPSYYTPILDPDPAQNIYRNTSYAQGFPFNPFEPDYDAYPLFRYIDGYRVHLKPGDVLWNPPYYWHAVRNLTDSIGVGYRWLPPHYCFKQEPLYFFLDLFVRNPSLWQSYKLAHTDINLIQLAQTGRLEAFLQQEKERSEASHYNTIDQNLKRKGFKVNP